MGKNWLCSVMTINGTFGVQLGRGAQPQVSGSGARLKELTKKLATLTVCNMGSNLNH
jgi:hypothetical protein